MPSRATSRVIPEKRATNDRHLLLASDGTLAEAPRKPAFHPDTPSILLWRSPPPPLILVDVGSRTKSIDTRQKRARLLSISDESRDHPEPLRHA